MTVENPDPKTAQESLIAAQTELQRRLISVRPTIRAELHDVFTSRKFWALVIGLVTDFFAVHGGRVDTEAGVLSALGLISAYCIGQGLADSKGR